MKKLVFIFNLLLFFSACVKDKPPVAAQPELHLSKLEKVYVVNEGGFGYNQASISLYDPGSGEAVEDLYKTLNNAALGDVAQSMSFINGNYYLVVNNSNKIIVCNKDLKKTGQIGGLGSPRYILPVTNRKAYVSDLSSGEISIVDLNLNVRTGAIACAGWTEKMVSLYNKVFVTNLRKKYIYVINTITDAITDSIQVGINTGNIVVDKDDKLWVLSSGDQQNVESARLSRIDPVSNKVESSFIFAANETPASLCLNKTKDTLYFINEGIYRFPVQASALPGVAFIPANNRVYYGLGINPGNFTLYAADALDYIQRSNVYIFDMRGNQLSFFKAGIISNGFYFE